MKLEIKAGAAKGAVQAPPSKSMAHRYLIAAALAEGQSIIRGVDLSNDIQATLDCLRALGVDLYVSGNIVTIWGGAEWMPIQPLNCGESGSTLRFMIPLCLTADHDAVLLGSKRLLERPLNVYEKLGAEHGFSLQYGDGAVFLSGCLRSGEYHIDGSVSSQFISGLMFGLVRLAQSSRIIIEGKIESRSYIDLTISALNQFGFEVSWDSENTIVVVGGLCGHGCELQVEGDYSNAAFFDALNLLGGDVQLCGLDPDSKQGDRVYADYFAQLKAGKPTLSIADCPDLAPILMVMAAALNGAKLTDTARLKIKESDRGAAMAAELKKCGVEVILEENSIEIIENSLRKPEEIICGHNDHRIVMSMAVLLSYVGGCIEGTEAVNKSLPDFFGRLAQLGIEVDYFELK